ncbi:hypothetical protein KDA_60460 [Dictyobacter alpinus]|uniref:Lipoprotein n=1 Tax=Dictyobacter alpinus TaxID=2014873 RepID=A0A402BH42_9CHLR|nr:hypothetical protein [Dictyobacter alpinus]GCE30562.1 hypothetical protein KDA_60460 [Dictyobacter alpinus]
MKMIAHLCRILCLLFLLSLLAACNNSPSINTTTITQPTATITTKEPTQQPLSAKQLLEKSQQAMKDIHSVHFTLDAKHQISNNQTTPTASLLQTLLPMPGTSNYNMWSQGQGDETDGTISQITLQEKSDGKLFQAHSGATFSLNQRIQGDSVYILGGLYNHEKWYVIDKKILQQTPSTQVYAVAGIAQVRSLLDLALQKGQISDKGKENISDRLLRHIKVSFTGEGLAALQDLDVENKSSRQEYNNAQTTAGSTDFWIDEDTGYVYQLSNLITTTLSNGIPIQQTLKFKCQNFNQSIRIDIPVNAIPASDLSQIYPPARG